MKKIIILCLIFIVVFNAGCSRVDSLVKRVPYFSDQEGGKKTEQDSNGSQSSQQADTSNQSSNTSIDTNELTLAAIFFNEIREVNGKNVIQNADNKMALVNKQYGLPETFLPSDLVRPNVLFSFGNQRLEKSLLRKEAALSLENMFRVAKHNGIELIAISGYRSFDYQKHLFQAEVSKVGRERAVEAVAVPGQSEHQTGLAIDISSNRENMKLTESFALSIEGKWLAENAHLFGFILRYPKGKESITGYQFEPWHFRYIGVEAATIIYKRKWTLEEYFNMVKKI